ncbi:MAG: RNA polymerase sigma-54 factor, partial [[Clostridium] scindens]
MELNLVQKQTQTLSPLMMQSMEILQMGTQELMEFVDKTLQENPVLEREDQFD